jgi:hypothetical protein
MKLTSAMETEIRKARETARAARWAGNFESAWSALERAHIISQPALAEHLAVHADMLALAIAQRDPKEICGQLLRLLLAPAGHLLGRTPWGNPGRSTVSKFARAALPADIAALYADAGIEVV